MKKLIFKAALGIMLATAFVNTTVAEPSTNLLGIWTIEHDGWGESMTVYDNSLYYVEDTMDGFEFPATFTKKDGNRIEIIAYDQFPGVMTYNPENKTLTVTVKRILDGKDFSTSFNEAGRFSAAASTDEDQASRVVYTSSDLKTKLGVADQGEALPIISLTEKWYKVGVPVNATGYAPASNFNFVKATVSDKALKDSYEASVNGYSVSYDFQKKDSKVAVSKNMMRLDGMGAAGTQYYGGTINGNAIVIDRETSDYSAYESLDFSQFEKLEKPFVIYVVEQVYYTSLIIDGVTFIKQEF